MVAYTYMIFIPLWSSAPTADLVWIVLLFTILVRSDSSTHFNEPSHYFSLDHFSSSLMFMMTWVAMIMATLPLSPTLWRFMILLLLSSALTFSASSMLTFFFFFEASLLPIMIIIIFWGQQPERLQASMYLLFYTTCGSIPLLSLVTKYLYIYNLTFISPAHPEKTNLYFFVLMTAAFLIKLPIYGLHFWLTKAHVQAPTSGSMALASILLKLGGYGLYRFTSLFSTKTNTWLMSYCTWGAMLASTLCIRQTDVKMIVALSSVVHMSIIPLALLTSTPSGVSSTITLLVAHGYTSSSLFFMAGILSDQSTSRSLQINKTLKSLSSTLWLWWIFFCMSNMSIPPSLGFVGEVQMTTSISSINPLLAPLTAAIAVMTATYCTLLYLNTSQGLSKDLVANSPPSTMTHLILFLHSLPLIFSTILSQTNLL